jgi:hypothetical protein
MYGGNERCIQGDPKERDNLKDLDVDDRII